MKITLLSDTHFGFKEGEELGNDSFEIIEEIIDENKDSDILIICGDIFDSRNPKYKVVEKFISSTKNFWGQKSDLKIVSSSKKLYENHRKPIITIYGNHDRPLGKEVGVLEMLETSEVLINLNKDYITFEKNGEKVSIFGMGNVQENLAKDNLFSWNPQPIQNSFNILLLHQNIYPYIFQYSEYSLELSSLPKNFNLIVNGHYHSKVFEKIGNTTLIMPGSIITTQFKEEEAKSEKYYFNIFTENGNVEEKKIKRARKFIYLKFSKDIPKEKIVEKVKLEIPKNLIKKPVLRVDIERDEKGINDDFSFLEKEVQDKCILILKKILVEEKEVSKEVEKLQEEVSLKDFIINSLRKKLSKYSDLKIDLEDILRLLEEEKNIETVKEILIGKQKTIWKGF